MQQDTAAGYFILRSCVEAAAAADTRDRMGSALHMNSISDKRML